MVLMRERVRKSMIERLVSFSLDTRAIPFSGLAATAFGFLPTGIVDRGCPVARSIRVTLSLFSLAMIAMFAIVSMATPCGLSPVGLVVVNRMESRSMMLI